MGELAQVTLSSDGEYVVWLRSDMSVRDQIHYLGWAWRTLADSLGGPDWGEDDGHTFKGHWNMDLDEGRYVVGEGLRRGRTG